eukprot:TRINITY_DN56624_c0_g1_i1.p1 TRINITY_DN56624_c0_g1~~TRINITY_DN56624_c0_g1_i1.p1  ORF type:complete len:530 (-),score=40.61 TRINITY_DN56624_c0_g1_i1:14-1579(-)
MANLDGLEVIQTTPRELFGWPLYDAANGAFFYGVLNFLPLLLKDQAKELAHVAVCLALLPNTTLDEQLSTLDCEDIATSLATPWCHCLTSKSTWFHGDEEIHERALVPFLGTVEVHYATVYASATAVSVVIQLVLFALFSSLADFGGLKRQLLLGSNFLGSACCIVIGLFGHSYTIWALNLNACLFILANASLGYAVVMYNAYLPLLVSAHPDVIAARGDVGVRERIESELSGRGVRAGMAGQILFLVFAAACIMLHAGLPAVILAGGLWTLLLGSYAILLLLPRRGKELPDGASYIQVSVMQLVGTCKKARELPQMFLFLMAYFIFSDGCSTVATQAGTMASVILHATDFEIILGVIEMSLAAVLGILIAVHVQGRFNVRPKSILLAALGLQAFLPLCGLFMNSVWQLYVVAFAFGFATGPQQAFTRSLFSAMIPNGHESAFFGFYEITDKGTAWLGPFLLSIVSRAAGFRSGYASLVVFFAVGIPILAMVNPVKASAEKNLFSDKEQSRIGIELEQSGS